MSSAWALQENKKICCGKSNKLFDRWIAAEDYRLDNLFQS